MLTGKRRSKVKLIGAFIILAGALVVVAAGVTLGMVSSELKVEHITVPGVAPEELARPPPSLTPTCSTLTLPPG